MRVMSRDSFEISVLYDFYGPLLSEKQRRFTELYHNENCSLTEIAEAEGKTGRVPTLAQRALTEGVAEILGVIAGGL